MVPCALTIKPARTACGRYANAVQRAETRAATPSATHRGSKDAYIDAKAIALRL
jgi:hypothetical protein